MNKRNVSYFLLGVLMLFLVRHTVAMKFLAPACYRMDLSLSVILLLSFTMTDKKMTGAFLVGKEILQILLGNPGVGIGYQVLITVSDTLMDAMLLCMATYLQSKNAMCRFTKEIIASLLYVVFCTLLNAIYHIRLYAVAYQTDLSGILSLAARYNDKVEGYGSLLLWSVAPFYSVKFIMVVLFAILLSRLFNEALQAQEQRVDK